MFEEKILHKDLSYNIVGLAMQLHTELGHGFLEKVYERALMIELKKAGLNCFSQLPIDVYYFGDKIKGLLNDTSFNY